MLASACYGLLAGQHPQQVGLPEVANGLAALASGVAKVSQALATLNP